MIHFKTNFHLFSFLIIFIFASFFSHTHLLSLPGCTRKCGNVIIISTFGLNIFTDRLSHFIRPILAIIVVVPLLATAWIAWIDREKKLQTLKDDYFDQNGGNLLRRKLSRIRNPHLTLYTIQHIKSITRNYTAAGDRVLSCCTQAFYRGSLSDEGGGSGEVAVVMIKRVPRSQTKRFLNQLIYLSKPHRRSTNLVRLIGCCLETHSPLLVYELHGDGATTLSDCTRDRARASLFSCEKRVKAAAALAVGFSSFANLTHAHGNICSANIVMDGSFEAKIFYAAGSDHEENDMYRDPEFVRTGRLKKKSDVYSFGVVLVELLTGRGDDGRMVAEFLNLGRGGRVAEILDLEMVDEGDVEVVKEVAALALRCLNVKPSKRPKMKEVEKKLTMLHDAISKGFHKVI